MTVFYVFIGIVLGALTTVLIIKRKFVKMYIKEMPIFKFKTTFVIRYTLARPFMLISNLLVGDVVCVLDYDKIIEKMER